MKHPDNEPVVIIVAQKQVVITTDKVGDTRSTKQRKKQTTKATKEEMTVSFNAVASFGDWNKI